MGYAKNMRSVASHNSTFQPTPPPALSVLICSFSIQYVPFDLGRARCVSDGRTEPLVCHCGWIFLLVFLTGVLSGVAVIACIFTTLCLSPLLVTPLVCTSHSVMDWYLLCGGVKVLEGAHANIHMSGEVDWMRRTASDALGALKSGCATVVLSYRSYTFAWGVHRITLCPYMDARRKRAVYGRVMSTVASADCGRPLRGSLLSSL